MNIQKDLINISGKNYCEKFNCKYTMLSASHDEKTAIPNYSTNPTLIDFVDTHHPETYVCELPNVNIIGNHNIIFDDNNYGIFDLPFYNTEDRYQLGWKSMYYVDKHVTCIDYNNSFETIDEGIMLITPGCFNYYHFNVELLTRLCMFNEMQQYDNTPLLLDEIILETPNLVEELNFLNKSNRKIIYLKESHSYRIKKLVYMSNLTITAVDLNRKIQVKGRYCDMVVDSHSIKLLNSLLYKNSKPFRKIYFSRKHTSIPRLLNEDIVEEVFKGFGYEIVYPEFLSFNQCRNLFSESLYIAGTLGSALTNILFCSKETTLICIQPKIHEEATFSCITNILEQNCYYVDAISQCKPPFDYFSTLNTPYTVKIDYLVKFLNEIHSNEPYKYINT